MRLKRDLYRSCQVRGHRSATSFTGHSTNAHLPPIFHCRHWPKSILLSPPSLCTVLLVALLLTWSSVVDGSNLLNHKNLQAHQNSSAIIDMQTQQYIQSNQSITGNLSRNTGGKSVPQPITSTTKPLSDTNHEANYRPTVEHGNTVVLAATSKDSPFNNSNSSSRSFDSSNQVAQNQENRIAHGRLKVESLVVLLLGYLHMYEAVTYVCHYLKGKLCSDRKSY